MQIKSIIASVFKKYENRFMMAHRGCVFRLAAPIMFGITENENNLKAFLEILLLQSTSINKHNCPHVRVRRIHPQGMMGAS